MASLSYESDSAEQASTTADEVEESSSRRSTTEDDSADSTTDTDSNTDFASKTLTPKESKKYANGLLDSKKFNIQSDTETKNLLDDIGEDFDEDYLNLQETEIEIDSKMFDISDEQLSYYTNCFLYLLQKTQGFASLKGALQGTDRTVLDFFRKSRLDELSLSRIWSLSDVNEDGFLNHCEFITAMHLIVLHIKGNMPIPVQLPSSARPPQTPTRSLVRFEDEIIGAFPDGGQKLLTDSTSDSSTKIISECISSNSGSGNSQQQIVIGAISQQQESSRIQVLAANLSNNFMDMSNTAKQHSFSDDQLNSTKNDGKTQIAKFSDVPPLLVDSQPTALNAITTSQIVPEFAQLFASTSRGPPPKPPYRDYNNGSSASSKGGHGRSVSLDLKTFSALSTNNNEQKDMDVPDAIGTYTYTVPQIANTSAPELVQQRTMLLAVDKSMQTSSFLMTSTATQTIATGTDDFSDENLAVYIRDMDTNKMTPKERCQMLQRINEQLELERSTLMQVRLQVQLRIEEAETELKNATAPVGEGSPRIPAANKPTTL